MLWGYPCLVGLTILLGTADERAVSSRQGLERARGDTLSTCSKILVQESRRCECCQYALVIRAWVQRGGKLDQIKRAMSNSRRLSRWRPLAAEMQLLIDSDIPQFKRWIQSEISPPNPYRCATRPWSRSACNSYNRHARMYLLLVTLKLLRTAYSMESSS